MTKIQTCLRVIDLLSEWSGRLVSYFIFFLALVVGYEVVVRYVFNRPTIWVNEVSAMFFGTFILIGGAYTASKGAHVNMDVIYGTFSPRFRALLDILTSFLAFVFVGVLVWKGGEGAWRSIRMLEEASTQWGPPLYPFRTVLPLGAFLLFLQLTAKLIRDVITLVTGKEPNQWKSEP